MLLGLKDALQEVLKDTFCKKLTLGGSAMTLEILQEVLKYTVSKKLTPGGSVLGFMIPNRKCLEILLVRN